MAIRAYIVGALLFLVLSGCFGIPTGLQHSYDKLKYRMHMCKLQREQEEGLRNKTPEERQAWEEREKEREFREDLDNPYR